MNRLALCLFLSACAPHLRAQTPHGDTDGRAVWRIACEPQADGFRLTWYEKPAQPGATCLETTPDGWCRRERAAPPGADCSLETAGDLMAAWGYGWGY